MNSSIQWKYLYRVLREDENHLNGLTAKDPGAEKLVADHVQYGSRFISQFISTTTTVGTAINFASRNKYWPKTIVKIDVSELQKYDHVKIIDLTCKNVLDKHIGSERTISRFYAQKHKEVLIKGFIPPSCVKFERCITHSLNLFDRTDRSIRYSSWPSITTATHQALTTTGSSNGFQPGMWYSPHEKHSDLPYQTLDMQNRYFQETEYTPYNESKHVMLRMPMFTENRWFFPEMFRERLSVHRGIFPTNTIYERQLRYYHEDTTIYSSQ